MLESSVGRHERAASECAPPHGASAAAPSKRVAFGASQTAQLSGNARHAAFVCITMWPRHPAADPDRRHLRVRGTTIVADLIHSGLHGDDRARCTSRPKAGVQDLLGLERDLAPMRIGLARQH